MKIRVEKEKELKKELAFNEEEELLKFEIKKIAIPQRNGNGKPYQSKIIEERKLVQFVEEGWEIVKELSDGRFLVKRFNLTGNSSLTMLPYRDMNFRTCLSEKDSYSVT